MKIPGSMMLGGLALLSVGAAPNAGTAPNVGSERVLDLAAGPFVTAIIYGHRMKLRVDFDHSNYVDLNPASAARAGLRVTAAYPAPQVRTQLNFGARKVDANVRFDRDVIDGDADGVIGPANLPENRVTLRLRAAAAGERMIELPVNYGQWQYDGGHFPERSRGLYNGIRVRNEIMQITYAPQKPFSMVSGPAGIDLTAVLNGRWEGQARSMTFEPTDSWRQLPLTISRPFRPMALNHPLDLNGLPVGRLLVWLPLEETTETGKIAKVYPSYELIVGQDTLSRCSSISLDKKRRKLTLSCL